MFLLVYSSKSLETATVCGCGPKRTTHCIASGWHLMERDKKMNYVTIRRNDAVSKRPLIVKSIRFCVQKTFRRRRYPDLTNIRSADCFLPRREQPGEIIMNFVPLTND
mmetsp:Transcript_4956/g.12602  ORF Transcript_4956/g.12602 Transcript_4956/m.12602 type:complete len:108 (-) Transcript_4956:76-399(-)